MAEAHDALQDQSRLERGPIRIGAIPTIAPYLLPRLVRIFTKRYQHAEVTVHEDFTEGLISACGTGEADVGLVALPIESGRITVERLFSEELLIALAAGHPLLKRRRVTLEVLTRE